MVVGLSMTEVLVLSFTERLRPPASGLVSSTFPSGHDSRGAVGSTTRTMSPTLKFFCTLPYFCLLEQQKVFLRPSMPEEISHILDLFPTSSGRG